jgi:iron(III) transport system ATP-binding protein
MRNGKLLQMASADRIYNQPADLFVASFTGASNLLSGRVLARNGEFGTVEAGAGLRLNVWLPPGVASGENVKVAVRPENVRLGGQAGEEPNRFHARITGQRFQGTQTVYELALAGVRLEALELGTAVRHAIGEEVSIILPPTLCWGYAASGESGQDSGHGRKDH